MYVCTYYVAITKGHKNEQQCVYVKFVRKYAVLLFMCEHTCSAAASTFLHVCAALKFGRLSFVSVICCCHGTESWAGHTVELH